MLLHVLFAMLFRSTQPTGPYREPPVHARRYGWLARWFVLALALSLSGCAALPGIVKGAGGVVCQEIVVLSGDPQVAPLCASALEVADAVIAIIAAHSKGGSIDSPAPYAPAPQEVYATILQRRIAAGAARK